VFDDEVLARLLAITPEPGETLLCVDRRPVPVEVAREATRVRMDGRRITAIGKNVEPFDALDTGLFVCDPSLFEALKASCREGDTTLSGGMRRLTASELVAGIDIGEGFWCDIDTVDDLAHAERLTRQPTRVDAASPARSAASGFVA
jgi:choline kinase